MMLMNRLASIFEEVFGLPVDQFAENIAPEQVPNWDSIGHMSLVARLEQAFSVRFEVDEVMDMSTPAKICAILASKSVEDA